VSPAYVPGQIGSKYAAVILVGAVTRCEPADNAPIVRNIKDRGASAVPVDSGLLDTLCDHQKWYCSQKSKNKNQSHEEYISQCGSYLHFKVLWNHPREQ
jgi:hypothetical protein